MSFLLLQLICGCHQLAFSLTVVHLTTARRNAHG